LANQVHFLGQCSTVPALLLSHQVFVLSTHYEGMPLAMLEAMAAGCAVVGSAVVGVKELLRDGVDGKLVAPADAEALAKALEELLRDPVQSAAMAHQARERALRDFGVGVMAEQYGNCLRNISRQVGVPIGR